MAGGPKFDKRKEAALAALLTAPSIQEAAKMVGVAEGTLYRWLREDTEFKTEYREAKAQAVGHAVTKLQQASTEAVETLRDVMNDQEAPPSSRVAAAKTTLEMAIKGIELEDLAARVEELEALAEK